MPRPVHTNIMWEKIHIGMTYKGVTQGCCHEILLLVNKEIFTTNEL